MTVDGLLRTFIAIELPVEVRSVLAGIQERLRRPEHHFVKWVNPGSIHLTLKFLGGVPAGVIPGIVAVMQKVATGNPTLVLEIGGLGVFPGMRRPRVLWVGMVGDTDRLLVLQRQIDEGLAAMGFAPEDRPFEPHLTLARIREGATPQEGLHFGELVQKTAIEASGRVNVAGISLMRSQLTPGGSIYTRLADAKLEGRG